MSKPEDIVKPAKLLVKQAQAIYDEGDKAKRESLQLDRPIKSTSETPEWALELRDAALRLNEFAYNYQHYDSYYPDLDQQLERVKQLLKEVPRT